MVSDIEITRAEFPTTFMLLRICDFATEEATREKKDHREAFKQACLVLDLQHQNKLLEEHRDLLQAVVACEENIVETLKTKNHLLKVAVRLYKKARQALAQGNFEEYQRLASYADSVMTEAEGQSHGNTSQT